jgi:protein involved in polysaccharide export with SLBB domain
MVVDPYRSSMRGSGGILLLMLACGLGAVPVCGAQQTDWETTRVQMSRSALEDLLQRLDASAHSSAYSGAMRAQAVSEAAAVRARLSEGDFQVGDRVALRVDGEAELTDTFTVGADRTLTLPIVGTVPLTGVLRSELEPHLKDAISKYVRDATVHARSLIRIAVLGEVVRPGFYTLPSESLVTDALMVAGGPTHDAKVRGVKIMRGDDEVWGGAALQDAMTTGKTLDQMSLAAGDRIQVPAQSSGIFSSTGFFVLSSMVAMAGTIYGIIRLF